MTWNHTIDVILFVIALVSFGVLDIRVAHYDGRGAGLPAVIFLTTLTVAIVRLVHGAPQ